MSVKCADIMSDQNVKLAGHIQNLVEQCPMTDCYFQLCFRAFGDHRVSGSLRANACAIARACSFNRPVRKIP